MSSYYQLVWRENELDSYSTDKLNFIFNIITRPFTVSYRQLYPSRIEWQKAVKKHEDLIKRVKNIILKRSDAHTVRAAWLNQHNKQAEVAPNGYTIEQLANKLPHMANQLGAFMEIENIEIKYFDEDFKPRYDLSDFQDIAIDNYSNSGFKKNGMTKEAFLKLYPQVPKNKLEEVLDIADCELEEEDNTEIIPYWYAINAKRLLVDSDSFTETFDN
ncbi:temperature-sensitive replication protein [Lactobacillus helveticus]|uniref:temperature-sensitive replication protein n=1 Tax=Lactobacillus TaxID=1578 RepID=UPI0015624B64|nr:MULTISPECIES: temperature-sensitive replication protein [Lactobacillus]MCP9316512.1 temperature-sensitive replication protein [Lactobacillus helveticus]MDH5816715.1 temperature-sensitive replication protein [Lactobacillus helveticus]MDN6009153.1 temperature-sensitive replication protein [Lactobacillus sp.]NRO03689.1 hypothetical protein [Lactobacillus helveticus]NRO38124.1 hypothetical protein [Lactobacillus helveticus]